MNPADYDKIREKDRISVLGLKDLAPGRTVRIEAIHDDGTKDIFEAAHSFNERQLTWFHAGSALNLLSTPKQA